MSSWLVLSILALVCWGITGNTQKISTNHVSTQLSFIAFALAFIPVSLAMMIVFPTDLHASELVWSLGILSGILNGLGALTAFAAFSAGAKSSVATPVMYLAPLVTVLMARLFLHEQISAMQWTGILLAPVATWLLSMETNG